MPGPLGHHLRHVLVVDLLLEEGHARLGGGQLGLALGHLGLDRRDIAVAQLRRALEIGLALGPLGIAVRLLEALLGRPDRLDGVLLSLPMGLHLARALAQVGQLALQRLAPHDRCLVGLLLQRLALDLELHDATFDGIDLGGHRVDLDAQPRGGLVDQVDGLVGQEAVGDVALRERGRGDDRRILDAHPVVHLVALLEPAQDGDRVLHGGLGHQHGLKAALQRGVLLDVLAVLVEGGCADRAQLAAGEHRLEQVGGVDGALGRARPHDRVQLVEEQDDAALAVGHLLEHGLEPVLELAAVLGPGDERSDVERDHAAVAQGVGNVTRDDALGQSLDDRRLSHARLADEHGVVLRAPREHLDHAAHLVVAPDHRVELACLGRRGEVVAVGLERLVLLLGVLIGHPVRAADSHHRLGQLVARGARVHPRLGGQREQKVLAGYVLVPHAARLGVGAFQHPGQLAADGRSGGGLARQRGERGQRFVCPAAHPDGVGPGAPQHGLHDPALLLEQHEQEMVGDHLGVGASAGQRLRRGDRLLGLDGESVQLHRLSGIAGSGRERHADARRAPARAADRPPSRP